MTASKIIQPGTNSTTNPTARPGIRQPADGADTWTKWSGLPDAGFLRLDIEWIDPVRVSLALAFTLDDDADLLHTIVSSDKLGLTDADPANLGPDETLITTWIPANPRSLTHA
ncbi:hypothetical protein ACWEQA_23640 [Nocardia sp. NPDC004085]